jgi:1-acyl-sn-glycerol-3-phosphate acyltransferase
VSAPLTEGPVYRPARVRLVRLVVGLAVRLLFRVRVEGRENLGTGPAIYCANHLNWSDPLIMLAVLPASPRFAMFGPREADMRRGARNRLIAWAGFGIPYRPEKTDMLETTRRVTRILADGWVIFIFGEGRIHRGERDLLPLADGTAFFALRGGVPIVPIAINGTSWLGFRRTIRIRIGSPIAANGRATREGVAALTASTEAALRGLIADAPDGSAPGPFGRWLTELFNEWPEGVRPEPVPVVGRRADGRRQSGETIPLSVVHPPSGPTHDPDVPSEPSPDVPAG